MHERVDKLAERLDRLDGIEPSSAPVKSRGILAPLADTPITSTLAVIMVILCGLALGSLFFNDSARHDEGYVSSNPTSLLLDAKNIEPPLLRVNHATDSYIDYTLFLNTNDRDAARNVELSYFAANQPEKEISDGTCLTTSQEGLLLKNCRTPIPYGTQSDDYTLRASLTFADTGTEQLDSATFNLKTTHVNKPDTNHLTAPISTMLAEVWAVEESVIRVDVAKSAKNRNRINTSDSFVIDLIPAKGRAVRIETKNCSFARNKPTQALFKCKVGIPEGIKAGRYSLNVSLFDGVAFNSASTSQFDIPQSQIP